MKTRCVLHCVVVLCMIGLVVCPPVDPKKVDHKENNVQHDPAEPEGFGLEYGRYLQQVVQILEEDKDFAKKLENISADSIKTGDVAHELEFVQHSVRTKLDELKRMELERLRDLVRQDMERNDLGVYRDEDGRLSPPPGDGRQWRSLPIGDGFDRDSVKLPYHLDLRNPHTFEVEDLKRLIKSASKDLDDLNDRRKEEFKRYEMEKEHQYREGLKHMTDDEKKAAEAKHQEMIAKHKDHPAVHHPGSKQQLEQVWEEVDQLPKDEFDPKTFFRMHDINGDGYLDEQEVKALVALEVRKMYSVNNTEDDPIEMREEFDRMEEHIFKEADKNNDKLISLEEFIDMTRKPDFEQDDGWKGLDEQQVYSPEELMEYERLLAEQAGYHPNMPYQGGHQQGGGGYQQPGYPPQGGQGGYPPQQGGFNHDQQYGYHPPPGNQQGVQFQQLPPHQQQQGQGQQGYPQHPPQGQGHPQGGQPMGQPHPNQPYAQQPHPGQPQYGIDHAQQGGQYPPHGGQYPPQGGQYPPQGGQHPPHGGQYPPQGGQHPPQGGQYPPQGSQHPPQGGQHPQSVQYPPQGGQHPPQGGQQYPPQGGAPPHQYPVTGQPIPNGAPVVTQQAQPQGVPANSQPPAVPVVSSQSPPQPQVVPNGGAPQQQQVPQGAAPVVPAQQGQGSAPPK